MCVVSRLPRTRFCTQASLLILFHTRYFLHTRNTHPGLISPIIRSSFEKIRQLTCALYHSAARTALLQLGYTDCYHYFVRIFGVPFPLVNLVLSPETCLGGILSQDVPELSITPQTSKTDAGIMIQAWIQNPQHSALWKRAYEAKFLQKGTFSRTDWDELLGDFQVAFGSLKVAIRYSKLAVLDILSFIRPRQTTLASTSPPTSSPHTQKHESSCRHAILIPGTLPSMPPSSHSCTIQL